MLILFTFCAAQNRSFKQKFSQKGLKIELFLQKTQKLFCVPFLRPPSKVTNFYISPMPSHFENFSLNTLNSEQKHSAKNRLTGPVKNRSTGRSTGDDFEIYRSGRVEKILTGSISAIAPFNWLDYTVDI